MPVSAVILGSLFLSEEIALTGVLGLITIGVGLAAIDGRPVAFLRRKRLPDAAEEKLV